MLRKIKSLFNRCGLDIRHYRPLYATLIARYGITTVLDIGANTGQFAREVFRESPKVKIYSFEPLADCFAALEKMKLRTRNFEPLHMALGERNEETFINRSTFTPSSSLLPISEKLRKNYPKSVESAQEQITVKRLDDIFPTLQVDGDFMIKIDVQGFESKVIQGGMQTISKAKVVLIETSFVILYEGQPLFEDIYSILTKMGFSYYGDTGRHYSKDGAVLLYEDSVFVKN